MSQITYADKLLPDQDYFSNLYRDQTPYMEALYQLTASFADEFSSAGFDLVTPKTIAFEEMSTPPSQLAFFNTLVQLTNAKNVLEIGTFIGHSAMQFVQMMGSFGHVTTIEVGKEFADISRENFRRNGFDDRITLIEGDAGTVLGDLPPQSFDLIFVDGSKQDYLEYTLKAEELLTDRGVIVVDDVFFHGDALNANPSTEKGAGCRRLLDHYLEETQLSKLLLPLSNGILVLFQPRSRDAA